MREMMRDLPLFSTETEADCEPVRGGAKPSPGPSKLAYRLSRAWAKPIVRNLFLAYLPLALLGVFGWRLVADDEIRGAMIAEAVSAVETLAARPEFAIESVEISGASELLTRRLHRKLDALAGASSLTMDVDALRQSIEAEGAVKSAHVLVQPNGTLKIEVTERIAAAIHRKNSGELVIIDSSGVEIVDARRRSSYPDLPLVLGEGSTVRVKEALTLLSIAPDLTPRLRAAVLVGKRRWDLVLSDDVIVMLPEKGAEQALSRVMAWHFGEDLLSRDIAAVDMRLPNRPVVRMTAGAAEAFRLRQTVVGEVGEDT